MKPLTPRQQQVFDLIKSKIDDTGMPPTRAEIARELGFRSANAAEEHLKRLLVSKPLKLFRAHRVGSESCLKMRPMTNRACL